MAKKVVDAQKALDLIRAGMTDEELMREFDLTTRGLQSLFNKLIHLGAISQGELDNRTPLSERTVKLEMYKCPACGMPQLTKFDVCPQCGVIIRKFKGPGTYGLFRPTDEQQQIEDGAFLDDSRWLEQHRGKQARPAKLLPVTEENAEQLSDLQQWFERAAFSPFNSILWRHKSDGQILSAASAHDDAICFGSWDGGLYCLARESGEQRWRFPADGPIQASPLMAYKSVYFGTLAGTFYALDLRSGDAKWRFSSSSSIHGAAVVYSGLICFGNLDGILYALEADTGEERGRIELGKAVKSSPIVVEGVLYVGCADGQFCAIG